MPKKEPSKQHSPPPSSSKKRPQHRYSTDPIYLKVTRETTGVFDQIIRTIRYVDYADRLPVSRFKLIVWLAILDGWSGETEEGIVAKAKELARSFNWDLKMIDLPVLRDTPEYKQIRECVARGLEEQRTPKTLKERIADPALQDRIGRETERLALEANDERVRVKAIEQIADRAYPIPRDGGKQHITVISEKAVALLIETQRWLAPSPVDVTPETADGKFGEVQSANDEGVEEAR